MCTIRERKIHLHTSVIEYTNTVSMPALWENGWIWELSSSITELSNSFKDKLN